jgi:hypothetical protein
MRDVPTNQARFYLFRSNELFWTLFPITSRPTWGRPPSGAAGQLQITNDRAGGHDKNSNGGEVV